MCNRLMIMLATAIHTPGRIFNHAVVKDGQLWPKRPGHPQKTKLFKRRFKIDFFFSFRLSDNIHFLISCRTPIIPSLTNSRVARNDNIID